LSQWQNAPDSANDVIKDFERWMDFSPQILRKEYNTSDNSFSSDMIVGKGEEEETNIGDNFEIEKDKNGKNGKSDSIGKEIEYDKPVSLKGDISSLRSSKGAFAH
jgi:hypothetical protein